MSKKTREIIVVIFIALVLVLLIGGRNNVVNSLEDVKLAEAKVQTMLQRRSDLIPNLVSVVKAYADHEETVFTEIAESRAKLANSINNSSMSEMAEADAELSQAIGKLLVLVESYPELKASEQFTNLQYEIAGSENRINIARIEYNEAVAKYNRYIKTFPGIVYARFFEYDEMPYFEADHNAEKAPVVDFD